MSEKIKITNESISELYRILNAIEINNEEDVAVHLRGFLEKYGFKVLDPKVQAMVAGLSKGLSCAFNIKDRIGEKVFSKQIIKITELYDKNDPGKLYESSLKSLSKYINKYEEKMQLASEIERENKKNQKEGKANPIVDKPSKKSSKKQVNPVETRKIAERMDKIRREKKEEQMQNLYVKKGFHIPYIREVPENLRPDGELVQNGGKGLQKKLYIPEMIPEEGSVKSENDKPTNKRNPKL